jgi:hypothetical protein
MKSTHIVGSSLSFSASVINSCDTDHQRIKDLGIKPLLTLLRLQKAVIGIDFQTCDECCGSNRP